MEQTTELLSPKDLGKNGLQGRRAPTTVSLAHPSDVRAPFQPDNEAIAIVQRIFKNGDDSPMCAAFAGVDHGSGCSRMAASTAALLANSGEKVCLLEANFRSPSLASLFGMPRQPGLAEALLEESSITQDAKAVGGNGRLWLVPAGTIVDQSVNLLMSAEFKVQLEQLKREFAIVIIDVAPISAPETMVISRLTDGVVLVLEGDKTRRDAAEEAGSSLRLASIPLLGAVLNKRTRLVLEKLGGHT